MEKSPEASPIASANCSEFMPLADRGEVLAGMTQEIITLAKAASRRDHIQGVPGRAATLLEYGDFECRACTATLESVQYIQGWLRGEMCFVFRHFPQAEIHPHAEGAAQAAEAAAAQGKFWEMHDCLFRRHGALSTSDLLDCAAALGLDVARFEGELRVKKYAGRVLEDLVSGWQSGVEDTPAFFINGIRYRGSLELDPLLEAIEQAGRDQEQAGRR
jgi:protein-disulfide isomerase